MQVAGLWSTADGVVLAGVEHGASRSIVLESWDARLEVRRERYEMIAPWPYFEVVDYSESRRSLLLTQLRDQPCSVLWTWEPAQLRQKRLGCAPDAAFYVD